MEKRGSMIEVLGVPDVLPADRTADKLHIYFLTAKHGGGEVLKVLYPCYQPGQAFITFEEPEVAARVLRRSPHVLEVNHQQYQLAVKAAEHIEMDLPVEATVHLDIFPDEAEVREILRSHDFVLRDLSSNQVRVKGSFLKLKAVKASLERLLNSQTMTDVRVVPKVSSGAVSKYNTSNSSVSHGNRGRDKPLHAAPSSPTTSSSWASGSSNKHPTLDQRGSFRPGRGSFVVDADVFRYAERLRKKDIQGILDSHNVKMEVCEVGDSFDISLLGKSARIAAVKLQSLMNDLNKSLRTQEVPLKDMDHEGQALLERIQKDKNIYNSVLICPMNHKLHLIGPSGESYALKQRLLGKPAGRTGRMSDRNSRRRSASLPPISRKNTGRDSGAVAEPSPVRAAGYSPSKYQDEEQEAAETERGAAACFGQSGVLRGRSQSESCPKTQAERVHVQQAESKQPRPDSPKKGITQLLSFNSKDIKRKFKSLRK